MKSNYFLLSILFLFFQNAFADEIILKDYQANQKIKGTDFLRYTDRSALPDYVHFRKETAITLSNAQPWMQTNYKLSADYGLQIMNVETDKLGFSHYRFRQTYKGFSIAGSMYILHVRNGLVESMNGEIYNNIAGITSTSITEAAALNFALQKIKASVYKWQIPAEENHLKATTKNAAATYFPKGELTILKTNNTFTLCYAFNIFAAEPMSRTMEYVDAHSGKILFTHNLIETVGTNGIAHTKFSGVQTIRTDSVAPTTFNLRDNTRGLGIMTLNLQNTTNYAGAIDFVDNDNNWNNINTAQDEAATDAHWGAAMTYDYYWNVHGRNSIDNAGLSLNSYLHYNTNYVNANWNGTEMTYGDGNKSQGFLIFTALDVCGHEITHGLTSYTAQLGGTGTSESDALNEGFSDIFGTCIERHARPTQWDWIIGGDITCNANGMPDGAGLRNMSNPALSAAGSTQGTTPQPICYLGTNWDTQGEPHNNNGPLIYWFYLLSTGNQTSNITALGVDTASEIAYRTLTVHLTSNATYADTRFYSILSSSELYGGCSVQTASTTNAWNKVCVGAAYVASPTAANFTADITSSCKTSATVTFSNTTTNGNSYIWSFGDGSTSTLYNPSHTYAAGNYNVKLFSNGGNCGVDSLVKSSYINIGPIAAPTSTGATISANTSATISATLNNASDSINWYANSTGGNVLFSGNTFTTPTLTTNTTYYAEEEKHGPKFHVGALDNTIGSGGNYTNTARYLTFDCTTPINLESVFVYAASAGNRIIELRDASANVLQTATVNIPNGNSRVVLNFPIPVGTNMQLGLNASSTVDLYRNNSGASYPYTSGPVSITGNNASQFYYYFFYDWIIKGDDCFSQRTATTVTVNPTGIDEIAAMGLSLYPNPFNTQFNLQFSQKAFSGKLEVYNILGEMIFSSEIKNSSNYSINAEKWASGNYILHLVNNEINTQVKLVKTN